MIYHILVALSKIMQKYRGLSTTIKNKNEWFILRLATKGGLVGAKPTLVAILPLDVF